MGNETASFSKACLKPGYFVTYSFSPVVTPQNQPVTRSYPPEEEDKAAFKYHQASKEDKRLASPAIAEETKEDKPAIRTEAVEELVECETIQKDEESISQSPDLIEAPAPQLSTVDYSDVSAAREALILKLKAVGKAQPLSNGETLEAMYRNKRKKTEAKGASGEVECKAQQSVATLLKQFSHSGPSTIK